MAWYDMPLAHLGAYADSMNILRARESYMAATVAMVAASGHSGRRALESWERAGWPPAPIDRAAWDEAERRLREWTG